MPNSNEKYRPTSGKRLVLIVEDEFINRELLREILADSYDVLTASKRSRRSRPTPRSSR